MKHMGIQTALLSAPDPGACITPDPSAQAALARQLNTYAAALRDEDPLTFGFLASLPDLRNTSAATSEIRHALDALGADGVVLYTRYGPGNVYLGNEFLDPVWAALDARNATVLVHPTHPADAGEPWTGGGLGLGAKMADAAHEVTRAALDMVAARTLFRFPNVKVVLGHAGGNVPWLMGRLGGSLKGLSLAGVAAGMGPAEMGLTREEVDAALGRFWLDVAGSTAPHVLRMLLDVVPAERIVYGVSLARSPSSPLSVFFDAGHARGVQWGCVCGSRG
jgi:predicted TIM-barrel fold metal-dependent hydrolase